MSKAFAGAAIAIAGMAGFYFKLPEVACWVCMILGALAAMDAK